MRGPLNRDAIVGLLGELSEKLQDKGVRGHIYIIGGAAMVLGFRHDGTTHDVDARIKSDKEAVLAAVAEIAETHGLGPNWFNAGKPRRESGPGTRFPEPDQRPEPAAKRHDEA